MPFGPAPAATPEVCSAACRRHSSNFEPAALVNRRARAGCRGRREVLFRYGCPSRSAAGKGAVFIPTDKAAAGRSAKPQRITGNTKPCRNPVGLPESRLTAHRMMIYVKHESFCREPWEQPGQPTSKAVKILSSPYMRKNAENAEIRKNPGTD